MVKRLMETENDVQEYLIYADTLPRKLYQCTGFGERLMENIEHTMEIRTCIALATAASVKIFSNRYIDIRTRFLCYIV